MLELKHRMNLPHIEIPHELNFSEIPDDDDELIQEIENASTASDDNWQLTLVPDSNQLEVFWSNVVDDIRHDPQWIPIGIDE